MLTDAKVKTLKAKPERYEVADGGRNGLVLRVTPNGVKTWALRYRVDGRPRKLTLGTYPDTSLDDARTAAALERAKLKEGIDPGEEKQRVRLVAQAERQAERLATTLAKLAEDYVKQYARPSKRSWREDERQLNADVVPVLGKLKARDVTREQVRALLRKKMDAGSPIAANRLLAVVRKMFGWAVDEGIIEENPCAGLKAPGKKASKDRVLTPDEIRKVWALLAPPVPRKIDDPKPEGPVLAMSADVRRALRLVLVTAQRPGEVVSMRWEDIEGSWWTIPAELSKNGLSHRVHLSKLALEVLGKGASGYVFPSPKEEAGHIHRSALSKAILNSQEALGTAAFTPHDLRRTAASVMAGAGVAPFTVERILNHTLQGVQALYNRHSYDAEKREALNRWAGHLGRILAGKAGQKVVEIGTRRKAAR